MSIKKYEEKLTKVLPILEKLEKINKNMLSNPEFQRGYQNACELNEKYTKFYEKLDALNKTTFDFVPSISKLLNMQNKISSQHYCFLEGVNINEDLLESIKSFDSKNISDIFQTLNSVKKISEINDVLNKIKNLLIKFDINDTEKFIEEYNNSELVLNDNETIELEALFQTSNFKFNIKDIPIKKIFIKLSLICTFLARMYMTFGKDSEIKEQLSQYIEYIDCLSALLKIVKNMR